MPTLTIRSLTKVHVKVLDRIMERYGRGCRTYSAAMVRAVNDWEELVDRCDRAELRAEEAERLVREHVAATDACRDAMDRESASLAALLKFNAKPKVPPRQLRIPDAG